MVCWGESRGVGTRRRARSTRQHAAAAQRRRATTTRAHRPHSSPRRARARPGPAPPARRWQTRCGGRPVCFVVFVCCFGGGVFYFKGVFGFFVGSGNAVAAAAVAASPAPIWAKPSKHHPTATHPTPHPPTQTHNTHLRLVLGAREAAGLELRAQAAHVGRLRERADRRRRERRELQLWFCFFWRE